MVATAHPWILTGPWYRWSQPDDPAAGRLARPVFQKFETADLANQFIADPQHSLKFLDPEDFVQQVRPRTPPLPLSGGKQQSLSRNVMVKTSVRKLFLDIHKRFYLVVCELHCDMPGLPSVTRDQVCEAGLVIRRRVALVPAAARKPAAEVLQNLALAGTQVAQLAEFVPKKSTGHMAKAYADAQAKFQKANLELQNLSVTYGVRMAIQGWVPSGFSRIGAWQDVAETPAANTEDIVPLYPLIPDPRTRNHSGGGRTIYFGLLPTGSADTDAAGNPRFDDHSLYEVRCYVRRHKPGCPKKLGRNDCNGELVWSRATEPYQLASHFDLAGSGNRPVTIQLPDIPALEAQAATLAPGQGAAVRMISPPGSPKFSVDTSSMKATPKPSGAGICSFSLPVITIVATFVFNLFLPVVTFIFGLFFLLKLKFCIPPEVDVSVGVALGMSAAFGADIEGGISGSFSGGVEADIAASDAADFSASVPPGVTVDPAPAGATKLDLPLVSANLIFEDRVEAPVA